MNKKSTQEIFDILKKIIVDALMIDPSRVIPEAKIYDDLGAESIDIVDMRFQIEHSFGLNIDQEEMVKSLGGDLDVYDFMEKFTVGWFTDFIERKLNEVYQIK